MPGGNDFDIVVKYGGSVYAYPYTGTAIPRQTSPSGGPSTGICDTLESASSLPSEMRNRRIVSLHQAISDKLVLSADAVYSSRLASRLAMRRGGLDECRCFQSGGNGRTGFRRLVRPIRSMSACPVPRQTPTTNISAWRFDELLAGQGLGYSSYQDRSTTAFATAALITMLGGDWLLSLGGTIGNGLFVLRTAPARLNTAEALLALNGTTNTSGTATLQTAPPLPIPMVLARLPASRVP